MGMKLTIILLCVFIVIFVCEIHELLKSTSCIKEEDIAWILFKSLISSVLSTGIIFACHICLM